MEKYTEEAMIGDTLTREELLGLILEERSMEKTTEEDQDYSTLTNRRPRM